MENEKNLIYSLTFILETQRHRVSITSINFINQPSRALLGGHTQRENLRFPGSFSPSRFSFQPYCPIVSSGCSPRGNSEHPQPGHRALLPVLPTPHPRVFPLLLGGTQSLDTCGGVSGKPHSWEKEPTRRPSAPKVFHQVA